MKSYKLKISKKLTFHLSYLSNADLSHYNKFYYSFLCKYINMLNLML